MHPVYCFVTTSFPAAGHKAHGFENIQTTEFNQRLVNEALTQIRVLPWQPVGAL